MTSRRDAALTAVVVAVTLIPVEPGGPYPWWRFALGIVASVPVLWRRRAPLTVAALTGVATSVLAMTGSPPPLPLGPLVCVYTFAALSPLAPRILGLAGTAAGVVVSLLYPRPDLEVLRYLTVAYLAAFALGTVVRARRAQVAALDERARRLEQERVAAVLRERARIARDLHDGLAHAVGIMVVQAEAGPLTGRADATFATIADTGRDALAQLRRVVGALREDGDGDALRPPGPEALPALVEQVRAAGIDATLDAEGGPVRDDVAVAAYRIVQEALTNTLRHARARAVRVRLHRHGDRLIVEVIDDGAGPAPGAIGGRGGPAPDAIGDRNGPAPRAIGGRGGPAPGAAHGHGLIGMRERALACGGTLETGPGPDGRGFRVHADLPAGDGA
ncbi:histidine kinase [Actinoplanes sichuanensis]|uniref:histidine kinase n=1 Tax=Actinoplanes sichuanensis TaxID=512349 RepID=A0ABW4AHV2_9ACTN|nr:sensor histidine kinase [Actinoplanes sichuanensis]BEL02333.1 histidine kinase [Actinoplanes sichuanensis]